MWSRGLIQSWKVDATITKLGWTTNIAPFGKWPPKWNYVFAYYSASRIDRDKILFSKPMHVFLDKESNEDTAKSIWRLVNSWLTRNLKWLSLKSTEITLIGPWAQWTQHAPARNVCNLSYFVNGTYPNMTSECHHHQIWMDYLYDAIFKMAANKVKVRLCLYFSI